MIRAELERLLYADPFQPFRMKLVNGDFHDVFYPGTVAVLDEGIYIGSRDQDWASFPYRSVASFESLWEDYEGLFLEHKAKPRA